MFHNLTIDADSVPESRKYASLQWTEQPLFFSLRHSASCLEGIKLMVHRQFLFSALALHSHSRRRAQLQNSWAWISPIMGNTKPQAPTENRKRFSRVTLQMQNGIYCKSTCHLLIQCDFHALWVLSEILFSIFLFLVQLKIYCQFLFIGVLRHSLSILWTPPKYCKRPAKRRQWTAVWRYILADY